MRIRSFLGWTACGLLAACGGGNSSTTSNNVSPVVQAEVQPAYHAAPVILDAPTASNAIAHKQALPAQVARLQTRNLTVQQIKATTVTTDSTTATIGTGVTAYPPSAIRSIYNLPALPASFTGLTSTQAAQYGAGQTIYLLEAYNDANILSELAAFNSGFGLPACSTVTLTSSTTLPLAAAPANGCQISVVYASQSSIGSTAPAYQQAWATETALDVEWAHATAPLARIVVLEAPDASLSSIENLLTLANKMGPGIVSMGFGVPESSTSPSLNNYFTTTGGMSYVAATGDNGTGVQWPAVSPNVLAVGATTLTYNSQSVPVQSPWSLTGGGVSAYQTIPGYQNAVATGGYRVVGDVSFNGDPTTSGQYIAVIPPGGSLSWLSGGGTSMATAQWAGVLAVINGGRRVPLGQPHNLLYGRVAGQATNYAAGFNDIAASNSNCPVCITASGYHASTGLGTPKVAGLQTLLATPAFTWGVNAHPESSSQVWSDPVTQIDWLAARGMTTYRFDLWIDTSRYATPVNTSQASTDPVVINTNKILAEANKKGVILHPMITFDQPLAQLSETQVRTVVKNFIDQFNGQIQDWELQNEMNRVVLPYSVNPRSATITGMNASDFNTALGQQWMPILRGMANGVHDSNPAFRTVVNFTDLDVGFINYLTGNSVSIDKVGYHYYLRQGDNPASLVNVFNNVTGYNIFSLLQGLGKPVIINEFNAGEVYDSAANSAILASLNEHIGYILSQTIANIEGVEYYEFFDDLVQTGVERYFGLYSVSGATLPITYTPKPQLYLASMFACGSLSSSEQASLAATGLYTASAISARMAACPAVAP